MHVLVTGGGGYIGSHMVLRLCDLGEEVVVVDNFTTGFDWAIDHRAKLVEGNAGDMALVGFFASGEIAYNRLYGYTGVLTVFAMTE